MSWLAAYLIVIHKDNDRRVTADLFNGVEVAHSIYLVQAAVDAHAGARLPRANGAAGGTLQLSPAALAPLAQEAILVVALGVVVSLAVGSSAAGNGDAVAGGGGHAGETEDAPASAAGTVNPLCFARRLEAASIGNDALDTGEAAAVKRGRRELELRGSGRRAHGGVDLRVSKCILLAEVVVRLVVVVLVLGVCVGSGSVIRYQLVEFVLGSRGRSHMGTEQ